MTSKRTRALRPRARTYSKAAFVDGADRAEEKKAPSDKRKRAGLHGRHHYDYSPPLLEFGYVADARVREQMDE
jgi:hypothetical protein